MKDDAESLLRSQYYEAIRRYEMEDEELAIRGGRRSVLPKLRSYPNMEDNGLFDEWNRFLDLFREIVDGWSLPPCASTRRARCLMSDDPCPERHIPGQCVYVAVTIVKFVDGDWERKLEVRLHDSGHGAFMHWVDRQDRWFNNSNFRVCIDVIDEMKTRSMLRRAQDTSPDIGGMSRLISASREFTIAAVFGNKTWMKDYSYLCFLGKGERSRPILKDLALSVRDRRPYSIFASLHDPTTISSGDLRYCSHAEMRDGIWHCKRSDTMPIPMPMPMQLEDKIAGTTN